MLALACVCAFPGRAADIVEAFGYRWKVPIRSDWSVAAVEGTPTLQLLVPRPSTQPRRPTQFALAETPDFRRVTVEAEIKKEPEAARNRRTSVLIVYAYQDEAHFNYAHLSVDTAREVDVHNGIFHVYGGDRVRISSTDGPAAFTSEEWHKVRLVHDGDSGTVEVWVDGRPLPSLKGVDLSLRSGKVGLGSFFDLGSFRNVVIRGEPVADVP
ncbi:MAG: hypothetical protein KIT09_32250 [Bryobacteraceae bacterium]|nr:hypothetical protein [Bryobacteraceae bacterium]